MATNAEALVAVLRSAGVRRAFGIPSGPALPVLDAMRRGGIEPVLHAHEAAAGFAADATARLTGVPGVCFATLGPGATNLATGVGAAFLDRSPLVALTWRVEAREDGRRIQMQIDHHGVFAPVTKASFALEHGRVAATTADALGLALSEPHGPVHLDITEAVSELPSAEPVPPVRDAAPLPVADLRPVVEALATARRPLLVVGANARRLGDHGALTALVERWRLPFATTAMAKGLLDERSGWSIGCIERGRRQLQREFIASADLVLAVGFDPIEVEYEDWIGYVPLACIDLEPAPRSDALEVVAEATGDLDVVMAAFEAVEPTANEWEQAAVVAHRERFQAALRPESPGFAPHEAIDAVQAAAPEDTILAYDVGAHTHQVAAQWLTISPRTHLLTNGWSSMGYGLPAAIGAKLARPDAAVIAIVGDGGFQMTSGEVATAARLGLTLPIIVLADGALSLIAVKQHRRGLPELATDLGRPAPPTSHFGAPVARVEDAAQLRTAVAAALAAGGPTVIEAVVDPSSYLETVFD